MRIGVEFLCVTRYPFGTVPDLNRVLMMLAETGRRNGRTIRLIFYVVIYIMVLLYVYKSEVVWFVNFHRSSAQGALKRHRTLAKP